jgi:hypothetical protein
MWRVMQCLKDSSGFEAYCDKTFNISHLYVTPISFKHVGLYSDVKKKRNPIFCGVLMIHEDSTEAAYTALFTKLRWYLRTELQQIFLNDCDIDCSYERLKAYTDNSLLLPSIEDGEVISRNLINKMKQDGKFDKDTGEFHCRYQIHTDQERAIIKSAQKTLPNTEIVPCSRHLAASFLRWMQKHFKSNNTVYTVAFFEIFHDKQSSPIFMTEENNALEAMNAIVGRHFCDQNNKEHQDKKYSDAAKYIEDRVTPPILQIVNYRGQRNPYLSSRADSSNNIAESFNSMLRRRTEFTPIYADEVCALFDQLQQSQLEGKNRMLRTQIKTKQNVKNVKKRHMKQRK